MKKLLCLLIIVVSVFGLTACNNNVSSDKLLARNWPGDNGRSETFTYDILHGEEVKGTMTQKIECVDGAFVLTTSQSYTTAGGADTVNSEVKFANAQGFYPTESTSTSVIAGVTKTVKIVYGNGKANVYTADAATIPESATAAVYDIASPFYDNKQFYAVLRGATYDSKFSLSFNSFIPGDNAIVSFSSSLGTTGSFTILGQTPATQTVLISRNAKIAGNPIKLTYATANITVGEGVTAKTVVHALVKIEEKDYTYSLKNIVVA